MSQNKYFVTKTFSYNKKVFTIYSNYKQYLSKINLSSETQDWRLKHIRGFLKLVDDKNAQLKNISSEFVYDYMMSIQNLSAKSREHRAVCIRLFLNYLYENGYSRIKGNIVFPKIKNIKESTLPSYYTVDEISKMISIVNINVKNGKRDLCILLFFSKLGLRLNDVRNLKFENILWNSNEIQIVQSKTNWLNVLPMDNTIRYEEKKLTQEERYRNSRKQSLLDNPKMLYFYGNNDRYFHDKDCLDVKEIIPEEFEASAEIPDKEICPKCQRRIYLRKACYPNTKQMGICDKILRDQGVSLRKIKHCVMDVGMKFHATSLEEILVEGVEDRWIIKGLHNKYPKLWHNNYVKTGPEERYITEGFHNQKIENKSFSQLLSYIENYSFEKHLKSERQAVELVGEENVVPIASDVVEEKTVQEEKRTSNVLRSLLDKLRMLFRI